MRAEDTFDREALAGLRRASNRLGPKVLLVLSRTSPRMLGASATGANDEKDNCHHPRCISYHKFDSAGSTHEGLWYQGGCRFLQPIVALC